MFVHRDHHAALVTPVINVMCGNATWLDGLTPQDPEPRFATTTLHYPGPSNPHPTSVLNLPSYICLADIIHWLRGILHSGWICLMCTSNIHSCQVLVHEVEDDLVVGARKHNTLGGIMGREDNQIRSDRTKMNCNK